MRGFGRAALVVLTFGLVSLGGWPVDAQPAGSLTLSVEPRRFSPNSDGRRDTTAISVDLDRAADVTVTISHASTEVSSLPLGQVSTGSTSFAWDGLVGGRSVRDGRYRIEAVAVDGSPSTWSAATMVTVDTRAPRAAWTRTPDPSEGRGRHRFSYRISDADNRAAMWWSVHDAAGQRLGTLHTETLSVRHGSLGWAPGRTLPTGNYVLRAGIRDRAGNLAHSLSRFRVHRGVNARVIYRLLRSGRRVALTFDDCVSNRAWRHLLNVLEAMDAHASFFCPGAVVAGRDALATRTVRDGHTIGSHGWDHAFLPGLSDAGIRSRLLRDRRTWWRTGGATTAPYFRPPYGAIDDRVVRLSGATSHRYVVLWDVDPQDWRNRGAAVTASHVLAHARAGSIVVMHVLNATADALPTMIRGLRRRGLEPSSLDEMFAASR